MRALVLVIFAAATGAVWWALTPASASLDDPSQGLESETPEPIPAGAEGLAGPPDLEMTEGAPVATQDRERDEVVLGHRVLVLDVEGRPAPDVPVTFYVDTEDPNGFDRHVARLSPGEFPGMQASPKAPKSGPEGVAALPTRDLCFAWATIEGASGYVLIPGTSEEEPEEPHTLQLHPAPMVELIVLDSSGQPVEGRLQFNAHAGSAAAIDLQSKDMKAGDFGSAWAHAPNQVCMLADGRRMFSLIPPKHARDHIGKDPGKLRFKLMFAYNGVPFPPRVFEDDVLGPIVYQLPESGALTLHLVGFPEGSVPGIKEFGTNGGLQQGRKAENSDQESWHFEDLPVGKNWQVEFWCLTGEGRQRHLSGTSLPPHEIVGPSSGGEQAEASLEFSWPAGFHGRLVYPDEAGLPFDQFLSDGNRGYLEAELRFRSGNQRTDWARVGVFPDGRFFIPLDPERRSHENTSAVSGFELIFRADEPREVQEGWVPDRLWAFVDATLPTPRASVDVGEVTLQHREPLFKVLVSDSNGEAVSGAAVSISFASDWDRPEMNRDRFYRAGRGTSSDARGEAWLIARDWQSLGPSIRVEGRMEIPQHSPHTLRVKVQHPDFLPAELDISGGERTAHVTLVPAATVAGSVLAFRFGTAIHAELLPVGAYLGEGLRYTTLHGARRGEETIDFKLEGVPPGFWDVAFKLSSFEDYELLRVSSVEVSGNGTVRDPRLQGVDLSDALGEVRLRLFREGGGRLTPAEISEGNFRLRKYRAGGGHSTGPADWVGDEIFALMPAGAEYKLGVVGDGWAVTDLGGLRPGTHDVYLKELVQSQVRVTNFAQLPEGVELDLMVMPKGTAGIVFLIQGRVEQAEVPLHWQAAGPHSVTWYLRKNSAGWSERVKVEITVTEEHVRSGGILELAIPESLLAAIPD
jgi:hypothetical protein